MFICVDFNFFCSRVIVRNGELLDPGARAAVVLNGLVERERACPIRKLFCQVVFLQKRSRKELAEGQ